LFIKNLAAKNWIKIIKVTTYMYINYDKTKMVKIGLAKWKIYI